MIRKFIVGLKWNDCFAVSFVISKQRDNSLEKNIKRNM